MTVNAAVVAPDADGENRDHGDREGDVPPHPAQRVAHIEDGIGPPAARAARRPPRRDATRSRRAVRPTRQLVERAALEHACDPIAGDRLARAVRERLGVEVGEAACQLVDHVGGQRLSAVTRLVARSDRPSDRARVQAWDRPARSRTSVKNWRHSRRCAARKSRPRAVMR